MPAIDEIQFSTFRRGHVRDEIILASFRNSLRTLINPATNSPYTEDEIALATQPGTRFYLEADSIDLYGQALQARARWMANQTVPRRSVTAMLDKVHGPQWLGDDSRLPAIGGDGWVSAPATNGAIFPGSTDLGSATAAVATDPNGARYQNLYTTTTMEGAADLHLQCIDTGYETNIAAGTVLTWSQNQPIGAEPSFTLASAFSGGAPLETDAEYIDRIESVIRYRPGAGNSAHFMAWTREVRVSVEYGFVYPTFQHAGSVMVCVTQKRLSAEEVIGVDGVQFKGPHARTSLSEATINAITQAIVPPYSKIVPEDWYVVVTTPTPQPSDCVVQLSMGLGTNGGWYDRAPWPHPAYDPRETIISTVTDQTQTHFNVTVNTNDYLPGMSGDGYLGDNLPNIMVWDDEASRFERLNVYSMTKSGTTVSITLTEAPGNGVTLTTGLRISPYTELKDLVSAGAEEYFDGLGPGELFDVSTDDRGPRASRYPPRIEIFPTHAGHTLVSRIVERLGTLSPDGDLVSMSDQDPDYPDDVINGPNMLTLGHLTIYPL